MKKIIFASFCLLIAATANAQDNLQNEIKPIIAEGKNIYKVEMANWIGNKIFPEKYKGKEKMEGAVSYIESDNVKTVFYSKGDKPKVLGTMVFDKTYDEKTVQVDLTTRELSASELELVKLRSNALKVILDASTFSVTPGAHFSVVPFVSKGERKVYILSESDKNNVVIFGNDYLLKFDDAYKMTDKKSLHKNVVPLTFDREGGTANNDLSSHTLVPETGEMVAPTDIAMLLLFEKPTHWSHHTFITENFIYFWNYAAQSLSAIPKRAPKNKE